LEQANLKEAHSLIVLAGRKKIANRNARSVLTAMTATRLLEEYRRDRDNRIRTPGEKESGEIFRMLRGRNNVLKPSDTRTGVIAELLFEGNESFFDYAGVNKLVKLDATRERFIAAACVNEGVTDLLLGLLVYGDRKASRFKSRVDVRRKGEDNRFIEKNNLFCHRIGELKPELRDKIRSKTFEDIMLVLRRYDALLIALHRTSVAESRALDTEFRDDSPYPGFTM
jgi:hypothetical protein